MKKKISLFKLKNLGVRKIQRGKYEILQQIFF